ncbi:MAG: 2-amino-4-hydroxy-6-hydroxymethyldihydropteridine diphosphokinase [Candidatus Auribacter fodinae]|jgi:2-amino-4-hydroxy-6-hydroxymethyldihydropteridine diphosphokinase|uniref:2-amino-4-hydroxy-6-hydroxymethyldihydropteridine pyrophosphokinase n=1 Tax=Candidatus Auribacter fodinae TaxID=2093366 RepID=A0A3A4QYU3_9BACT|nr:MAG: 2-amino-4-hydroxy-6-hydroxymethyldihydropteridine diphosphokinase [Candidatus Auribacter fodinae]
MNCAVISVGSNIEPYINIEQARSLLGEQVTFIRQSALVQTKPLGFSEQPDFINGAFLIKTSMNQDDLTVVLKGIEKKLGRVKTADKNGPRTIDLDIVVWNGNIIDNDYYTRDFLRQSVRELLPSL